MRNFTKYTLLGDDLVIANSLVAKRYLNLMKSIGISISIRKSFQPHPEVGLFPVEFASKLQLNGEDVSPLPLGLLLEGSVGSIFTFTQLMRDAFGKDRSQWFTRSVSNSPTLTQRRMGATHSLVDFPQLFTPLRLLLKKKEQRDALKLEGLVTLFGRW